MNIRSEAARNLTAAGIYRRLAMNAPRARRAEYIDQAKRHLRLVRS